MKEKEREMKEVTFRGTLMPGDWDDDDNIIALEISTDDDVFQVEMNGLWDELKDLVESSDEEVEVTGYVTEERDGTKWVRVTGYDVLSVREDEDDEAYSYDEDDPDFEEGEVVF